MTRDYFIEEVTTWSELLEFCGEEGCYTCEDIIYSDDLDELLCNDISEAIRHDTWTEIRDALDSIETGYDFYVIRGTFNYEGADDDFDYYKDEVLEWGDYNDKWDEPEDEEDAVFGEPVEDCEESELQEEPLEDEDFSVGELVGFCGVVLTAIRSKEEKDDECEEAFDELLGVNQPMVLH